MHTYTSTDAPQGLRRAPIERLEKADLSSAPISLRRGLAELPDPSPGRRGRRWIGGIGLLAAALIAIAGVGVGGALQRSPERDIQSTIAPTATVVEAVPSPLAAPAGFDSFEAPGIAFMHPDSWIPSTVAYPDRIGTRFVETFARGLELCPFQIEAGPVPTRPAGCETEARHPGKLIVRVSEYLRQLPGADMFAEMQTSYAGYPAASPGAWRGSNPATLSWLVSGPDDSVYVFWAQIASTEIETVRREVEATLATLRLSSWQPRPEIVDGLIHVETGQGFTFDYPADWTIYYPSDTSMMDYAVVTVASGPLEPPCETDDCQRFSTPPGTAAIEFRIGSGPNEPAWRDAGTTVGGQPAFTHHWDGPMATSADEGDTWDVRLDDQGRILGIYSSLKGPDIDAQQAIVERVIDSVTIDAPSP
jgi:hypothetical protein